ncbi:MAG: hydroxymethylglutaryl-CoA lyase [Cetobacterium sp.]|uniref:hydroxymethylglutaryl-CoA lyase n=1 Tax=unclassified Cetobacterium TaxID=2630983 RepID=UPI0006478D9C|nr:MULTISPECIES: hydroxymethylglutaryl-CoA lyase [unclassified Cetobacterium]
MNYRNEVEIIEIGPRDGFQNVTEFIATNKKKEIIEKLIDAGMRRMQLTSFVSPKHIPQMQDAEEIVKYFLEKYKDIRFFALVPNYRGAKRAFDIGLREITYVISVSEGHNKANVNRSVDESFEELKQIIEEFPEMYVNLDAATVFGCPFDGEVTYEQLEKYVEKAVKIGITTINLCDTIGVANPTQVKNVVENLLEKFPNIEFHIHIHDTRNMGMLNSYVAIESGIKHIQASIGGMGGCPFAPGASGNLSTEDFVYMLDKVNIDTGIDFKKLLKVAKECKKTIPGVYSGHHINIDEDLICVF